MGGGGPLVQLVSAEERVWCQYVESKVQCCVRSTAVNSVFHYSRLSGLALKRLWSRNIWNGDFSPVRSGSIPRRRVAVAEGTGDLALFDINWLEVYGITRPINPDLKQPLIVFG